jgi:hypothetical protein
MSGVCERQLSSFVVLLCLAAAPVRAQSAPVVTVDDLRSIVDVAAGVSIEAPADVNMRPACQALELPCASGRTFPDGGLFLSAAVYPGAFVGLVGELSTYANAWLDYQTACPLAAGRPQPQCPVDRTNHVPAALAGVRIRTGLITGPSTRGRLFLQVLAGPQWSDVGPRQRVIQPGVGYDGYLRNGMAVRVEADYRIAPNGARDLSTERFTLGLVVPLGSR